MIALVNNCIQRRLKSENLPEVSLTQAAEWLNEEDILKNSKTARGNSLRRHVTRGNILGVYKKNNYFWFIKRIKEFDELINVEHLSRIFNLKSRTSLYRKIKYHEIPYRRKGKKGIYFSYSDLVKWALENNRIDIFDKIKDMI